MANTQDTPLYNPAKEQFQVLKQQTKNMEAAAINLDEPNIREIVKKADYKNMPPKLPKSDLGMPGYMKRLTNWRRALREKEMEKELAPRPIQQQQIEADENFENRTIAQL